MAIAKLAVHQNANLFEAYLDFVRFDPDSIAGIASMATFRDAVRRDGRVANAAVRCITRAPPSAVNTAWISAITEALPVLDTAHLLEALPFLTVLYDGRPNTVRRLTCSSSGACRACRRRCCTCCSAAFD